ncbi:MAG: hypothetical protein LBE06_09045 [Azoarcus sp.]|jgi:hypothetical protein|nr:hypothetical protein [Azoarcus sp.]
MIIWQGLGWLIGLILVVAVSIVDHFLNDLGMGEYRKFGSAAIFLVSGLLTLLLKRYLRNSGELSIRRHTFFFIPVRFWAVIFMVMGILSLVRPPPETPNANGELIRPLVYLCDSGDGMKRAITAISAISTMDGQLSKSGVEGRRRALLNTVKGCGILGESSLPVQIESPKIWQEKHASHNWHIANGRVLKIKGKSLKFWERTPVWVFHRYETEADVFIQMEDGKKW